MSHFDSIPDLTRYEQLAMDFDPRLLDADPADHSPLTPSQLHAPRFISPRLRRKLPPAKLASIQAHKERIAAMFAAEAEPDYEPDLPLPEPIRERRMDMLHFMAEQAVYHA